MPKNKSRFTTTVSIDGEGIRGITPGQILVAVEDKLKKKTNNPDARIANHFDFFAGTSTSGILSCAYLCPNLTNPSVPPRQRYSAQEVVDFYLERGDEIFHIPVLHRMRTANGVLDEKYPIDELEAALKDYFEDTQLSQLLAPCLITCYDIKRRQGLFFTQHDALKDPGWNFLARDVARTTSAAPTYFERSKIKSFSNITYPLIDGGVFVNNPTLCAYAEVHDKLNVTAKDMVVLSLGTGFVKNEYYYNSAKNWGLAGWVKPLIDIMMSGVADVVDYQIRQMFHAAGCARQYLRVNKEISFDVNSDMDDASQQNLNALTELGTETAQENDDKIEVFLDMILN